MGDMVGWGGDDTTPEQVRRQQFEVDVLRSIDRHLATVAKDIDTIKWLIILGWVVVVLGALLAVLAGSG